MALQFYHFQTVSPSFSCTELWNDSFVWFIPSYLFNDSASTSDSPVCKVTSVLNFFSFIFIGIHCIRICCGDDLRNIKVLGEEIIGLNPLDLGFIWNKIDGHFSILIGQILVHQRTWNRIVQNRSIQDRTCSQILLELVLTWNLEDLEMLFCEIFIRLTKSKGISAHVLIPVVPLIVLTECRFWFHPKPHPKTQSNPQRSVCNGIQIRTNLVQDYTERYDT